MDSRGEKIKKLKEYFEKRNDVLMAFLFGSQAKKRAHGGSDWDIAAYFMPAASEGGLEYEEVDRDYPEENRMWADITAILKTDNVDLLVLNRAPASVADAAIRGEPLVIKDRRLWLEFMLVITGLAEDFRFFARDYYEIYQRSKSITAGDAERLGRIIEFIESQMTLYNAFSSLTLAEYEADLIRRGAVERWVESMVNAVVDVSKITLSSSKKTMPYGYADTIRVAALQLGLPKEFWDKFLGWIKLRNLLAHEYLGIKWNKIDGFIKNSEPYFLQFLRVAKEFLENNAA